MYFLAHLGVAGLSDTGYQFFNSDGTANGSRITTGIVDEGLGWYSTNATVPGTGTPKTIRWNSTGTPAANAREVIFKPVAVGTALGELDITAGVVKANVTQWIGAAPDALSSGKIPADLKLWLATAPLTLSAQMVQAIVGDYASGKVPLQPTVAGRTLDVTATGEAGIDLDNTAGTLAKGTDITGFNDISAANVQTELNTYGALKPTTVGRTLDVSVGGEAGVDWANVGSPATSQTLSATTIGTVTNLTNDPPGVTTLLSRITSTLFTGITSLAQWLGLLTGKQVGNATARTEVRATGAGSGTFDETTDSQEAIRDRGDVAWITGAGGDPWLTALPGAYGAGTAGNIVGNNLNATVSSRATPAQVQTELATYGALKPTVAGRTLDVAATGEAGVDLDNSVGTLAKGTEITGFNDVSAAQVNTEVDTAIADARLDELLAADSDIDGAAPPAVGSVFHELLTKTVGSFTYDQTTDSQEAIRDNQGTPQTGDSFAVVNSGVHGNAALKVLIDAVNAFIDTEVAAIKAKTDQLIFTTANQVDARAMSAATDSINAAALAADAANEIRDAVWAKVMSQLATVPGVTGTALEAVEWVFLVERNKITQNSTTQALRNDADSSNIATSTISDDGTTFIRGKFV